MADGARTHFRTCHLCEAMCGIAIDLEGDRIVKVRGDRHDPFSGGHICPKAIALQDVHDDPDRLRRPLRRTPSGWEEVSWEAAFDEAATRLAAVQRAHGRNAVALYQGNPVVHNHGAILFGQLFQRSLGSRSRYSATSVDQLPQMLASLLMFGHQLMLPIPDVDRTEFLLVLGANPLVSNGSILTAPGIERRLKALKARGGRLVVVDPRRTETAALADLHLPIRPGGDAFLLAAIIHALAGRRRLAPGRLAAFTDGLPALVEAVQPFSPERVAERTGIDAETTRALALDFAEAKAAVAYGRVGTCTQEFGGLASWLVNALNVVTGNLDRPGGAMFTAPAVDLVGFADRIGQRGHFDKGRSRVRGLPEFGGEWPAAVLAEEIETPGEGQLRALVTSSGNPVLSTPNGARLDRALASLDFMVSIDLYLNETSRHAHLILPPTFALERSHYDLVFHALAVRNTVKFSEPLFPAPAGSRHDWQILLELATRLQQARGEGGLGTWLRHRAFSALGPDGLVALLLRFGPRGKGLVPFGRGLSLARLRRDPHGIDLGPLEPRLPRRLCTKTRRIELAPERLLEDLKRLRLALDAPLNGGLTLVGRRELRSNNSWMHNCERLVKGKERCTLLMHPQDAGARGLRDGERVRVASRAGVVEAPLELSDEMRPGVVCLPHGWGHQRPGTRLAVASARPGVSFNDLADEALVDPLCGTARLNDVPVEVTRALTVDGTARDEDL
jgi:anaerobic selenocysteine-containing dehydrogenase